MDDEGIPLEQYDFINGATLLVDKPAGWTSFDVVNKVRYKLKHRLQVRKIKVGHAGTLDPMATGLLILCTGKATKKLLDFQGLDKTYTGTLRLGATTPSYDSETEIDETFPYDHITQQQLEAARHQFIGRIEQVPPVFSAIKVDGQPLYKRARKGEKVTVEARPVKIYDFELTRVELPEVDFSVHCSKGTYIRSLAFDFGAALNSGAYLTALRRTSVGPFHIRDAWQLDDLIDALESGPSPL
ncbi:MAG: tRNA pseudouridine(55) synthase TruB [Lewinellaceae bacterium]|nr:tRNA pseudouridine(55) synthase TruB [Lewinella sp.]MCB9278988.1 tRNA pseudouridine(55) synthase TruB [Lewinellaceae bacterium]